MAVTKQGAFPTTYHHIDAPTYQDEEYGKQTKKRKLMVAPILPRNETFAEKLWRDPLVAMLASGKWNVRRKLDGENIRIRWDGNEALWNGKTDKFTCDAKFTEYMNSTFIEEIFEEEFGHEKEVIIFGEKMGPKTQGNELMLDADEVIVYDVCINGYWLDRYAVQSIAEKFHVRTCYDLMGPNILNREWDLCNIIRFVATGQVKDWEGVVCTPTVECRDQQGHRVIVKVKNKDYYRKEFEGDNSFLGFL